MTNAELIARVRALSAKATQGPWEIDETIQEHERDNLINENAALNVQLEQVTQERDQYKTLASVGEWHNGCRPNRTMAVESIQKLQQSLDQMADAILEVRRERDRAREIALHLRDCFPCSGTDIDDRPTECQGVEKEIAAWTK